MLRAGATIRLAAEAPQDAEGSDINWTSRLGPAPDIYSPQINHWLFRAAQIVLNETDTDLCYFHTTDYPMHMEPPWGEMSLFHLSEWDRLLGEMLDAHPDLEVYMSADHGMNFKSRCYDLNKVLPRKGAEIFFAMSAERDPYVKHHRTFGGTAFVWLKAPGDFDRGGYSAAASTASRRSMTATPAPRFLLHPDRIGDMLVIGDIDTVFGPLEGMRAWKICPKGSAPTAAATRPSRRLSYTTGKSILVYGGKSLQFRPHQARGFLDIRTLSGARDHGAEREQPRTGCVMINNFSNGRR